jgi:hypothetical protein
MAAWLFVLVQVWRVARSRAPAVSSAPSELEPGQPQEDQEHEQDDEVDSLAGPMAGAPDEVLVRIS